MRSVTVTLFLIAVAACLAVAVLLFGDSDNVGALGWLATAATIVLTLGPVLASRNDRVRLFLLRLRYRLSRGSSLPWALTVSLRGDFSSGATFDRAERALREMLGDRLRVVQPRPVNGLRMVVQGLGYIEVMLDDPDEQMATEMTVDFSGMRVAPLESAEVLERELLPVVTELSKAAGGTLRQESWSLKVSFDPDSNPFLGLYLRDRDQREVATFKTTLLRGVSSADRVDIDKSGIYLSSANAASLLTLARDFLTFSDRAAAPAARA
jgi:hypothetical protein